MMRIEISCIACTVGLSAHRTTFRKFNVYEWVPLLLVGLILLSQRPAAQELAVDPDIDRYVWDLSPVYASDAEWEKERSTIVEELQTIGNLKGTVGKNADSFAHALDKIADLRRRAGKMAEYGVLVSMADTHSEKAQTQYNVGLSLEAQVEGAISFVEDEVRSVGAERIAQYMSVQPSLELHRRRIHEILREAPHRLTPDAEEIVGSLNRWPQVSWDTYWALTEADLGWPIVPHTSGCADHRTRSFARQSATPISSN